MKNVTHALFLAAVLSLTGCSNTQEGLKKDTEINSENASAGAKDAMNRADEAGKDLGAATMLTPKIKSALTADTRLNDSKNLIDVSSTNEKVTLDGHVTSQELKDLAGQIAQKEIADAKGNQKLENNLKIQ